MGRCDRHFCERYYARSLLIKWSHLSPLAFRGADAAVGADRSYAGKATDGRLSESNGVFAECCLALNSLSFSTGK
jgi:hypothetical protein